jgi:hypothetical protein
MARPRRGQRDRPATERQGYAAVCPVHGKRSYVTRADARRAARTGPVSGLREYRCTAADGYWHLGHLPRGVRLGHVTAADVYQHPDEGTTE